MGDAFPSEGAGSAKSQPSSDLKREDFIQLLQKNVKELSMDELAAFLNFLTMENQAHWTCVVGELGYVVNIAGDASRPGMSYTFRLVDSGNEPALAIHQYDGLNASAAHSRGHRLLKPAKGNEEVFASFGRFLATAELMCAAQKHPHKYFKG